MFYVKVSVAPGVSMQIEIHSDNVTTHCHKCGEEMQVDLSDVFADGEGDWENTELLCPACAATLLERMREP